MSKIDRLVFSYRTEPTLCVVGDGLNKARWLWKMYAFLSQFSSPEFRLKDDFSIIELEEVTRGMYFDVDAQLRQRHMSIVVVGGNLYLSRDTDRAPYFL